MSIHEDNAMNAPMTPTNLPTGAHFTPGGPLQGRSALREAMARATRLETHLGQRFEPVTYWTVVGDHITTTGVNKKLTEMRYGLRGRVPDGMLVRVSSIDRDSPRAHRIQAEFAAAMQVVIDWT